MKKKSFLTLIVFALLMALTLSIAVISASAETPVTTSADLTIKYCNLSLENEVHIMYAIESDSSNVKLLAWTEPQEDYTYGTQDSVIDRESSRRLINGSYYTVFKYRDFTANQMADYVYVRAYNPDTGAYGNVYKYSILQYVYSKLGKTGTASKDEDLKALLSVMLDYGAATQVYFDYRTDNLANADFSQVIVTNGTLSDGFTKGLYKVGNTVTVTAPATDANGFAFARWEDDLGNTVSGDLTATLTVGSSNVEYTAVYSSYTMGLSYTLSSDNTYYTLTGIGTAADTEIVIPSAHNELPVKAIAASAFENCTSITSIELPESVTTIGTNAFSGCTGLTSIAIPKNVSSINATALNYCYNLESITVDSENASYSGVNNCLILKSTKALVAGCKGSVIPTDGSVTSIGANAFLGHQNLAAISTPQSVTSIGANAFDGCSGLESVSLSSGLTTIGNYAFVDCAEISTVTIPETVTSLGTNAFQNCTALETLLFADNSQLKTIGTYAFYGCSKLGEVNLPANTMMVNAYAFQNCTSIKNVTVPDSVLVLGASAFDGCTSLEKITFTGTTKLRTIGQYAFRNCSSLSTIIIPISVTTVAVDAFKGCSNLIIYAETASAPSGWNASWNPDNCAVFWGYVKSESGEKDTPFVDET